MNLQILNYQKQLKELRHFQQQQLRHGASIETLLQQRTAIIDQIIIRIGNSLSLMDQVSLIACGGYGRKELYPYSDIDLLILYPDGLTLSDQAAIEKFVTLMWDIGLVLKQNVSSFVECRKLAATDPIFFTGLLDARFLTENFAISSLLQIMLIDKSIWPLHKYLAYRLNEMNLRQQKYSLENPDVKNISGGLRDLQTLEWLCWRLYGNSNLTLLVENHYLSKDEYAMLKNAKHYLQKLRFSIHCLKNNDKLSEDLKPKIDEFIFPDSSEYFFSSITHTQNIINSLMYKFSKNDF